MCDTFIGSDAPHIILEDMLFTLDDEEPQEMVMNFSKKLNRLVLRGDHFIYVTGSFW